jgi:hypothetical protein
LAGALLIAVIIFATLKPYQRERILIFLKPGRDPRGSGYSMMRIGGREPLLPPWRLTAVAGAAGAVVALIACGASTRRVRSSATPLSQRKELPSAPPPVLDLLRRAEDELSAAGRLLSEVYSIGLWVQADDSSDNRSKRNALRETDWAVSGAWRALSAIQLEWPDLQVAVASLAGDTHSIVRLLEPLPDTIADTMGENLSLDATMSSLTDQVAALRERVQNLIAECMNRSA